jgi:hypothetical protein
MKSDVKRRRVGRFVALLVVCVSLLYGYMYILAATTSADDLLECKAITRAAESHQGSLQSTSSSGRGAMYCDAGVDLPFLIKYDRVTVYGVTDTADEDRILLTLKSLRQQFRARRILVAFYKTENWQTRSDPKTGNKVGYRGPETIIRSVWLK